MGREVVVDIPPPPGLTLPIAYEKQFPCVRAQLLSKSEQTTSFITWIRKMDKDTHAHMMEGLAAAAVLAKSIENKFQQD